MTSLSCTLPPSLLMFLFTVSLFMFRFIVSSFVFVISSFVSTERDAFVEFDAFVAPGIAMAGFAAPVFATAVFVAPDFAFVALALLFFDALVLC